MSFQQTQSFTTAIATCFNRNKLQVGFPLGFNTAPFDTVLRTAAGLYYTSSLEKTAVTNKD